MPSALQLKADQEARLLEHLRNSKQNLETELGRDSFSEDNYNTEAALGALRRSGSSHFAKRHLAHLIYNQQFYWRAVLMGGVYAETNVHLPLTTRVLIQQIARANKSFFGTAPYLAASPRHSAVDKDLSKQIQSWLHYELEDKADAATHLQQAIELAFIQGECPVKTAPRLLTTFYDGYRTIAINPQSGEPFIAEDGDYIYRTDTFIPDPQADPESEEPLRMVLSRDQQTPKPAELRFDTRLIQFSQVVNDHVAAEPIYYQDFLMGLHEKDVQSADHCIHLYDSPLIEFAHRLLQERHGGDAPQKMLQRVRDIVNELLPDAAKSRDLNSDGPRANHPRTERGESAEIDTVGGSQEPRTRLAEHYVWFDVFGDGVRRNLFVLTDSSTRVPVYYDYLANVTEDGERPIDIVRINNVNNRWYGQGNVDRLWELQNTADLILNRWFFSESRAARVDFWNPDAIEEGANNPDLELNWGGTYRLKSEKTVQDALQSVYLTNTKGAEQKDLLELTMQAIQSLSAVTNVNDGAMANMDTQKLATGIRNLERSGEEMFQLWMAQLTTGLERIVSRASLYALRRLKTQGTDGKEDLIRFFDRSTNALIELSPSSLQGLDLDVRFELTTYKSQSQLTQAKLAYDMLNDYLNQPLPKQLRMKPLVEQYLRSLEVLEIEKMIEEFSPEEQQIMIGLTGAGSQPGALPMPENPDSTAAPNEPII